MYICRVVVSDAPAGKWIMMLDVSVDAHVSTSDCWQKSLNLGGKMHYGTAGASFPFRKGLIKGIRNHFALERNINNNLSSTLRDRKSGILKTGFGCWPRQRTFILFCFRHYRCYWVGELWLVDQHVMMDPGRIMSFRKSPNTDKEFHLLF